MTDMDKESTASDAEVVDRDSADAALSEVAVGAGPLADEVDELPTQLGALKYVQAAFFGAAVLCAFLLGKVLAAVWNQLADWPTAVRALPALQRYPEDQRSSFTMVVGALVGVVVVVRWYRDAEVRQWADEVAAELSKVVWPDKDTVSNGTVVVIIASAIATVYISLLDRFWGFLTTLVYGA